MSKEYCNICCDSYNKSTREKVCCGYCEFPACKTCCETYILSETIPKCMNPICSKEWSRKFIRENFTNVFINTRFKNHLEEILFDQEKALMPATQPIIEEKIRKDNIKKEMTVLDNLIQDLYLQKRQLERNLYTNMTDTSSKKISNYVRACSAEGCRGFLSNQWKCGICEQWTCPECHELKGLDRDCQHTCNPDLVETAKLLAKDTKSCPKCQTKIFKIDGCFSENTPILMWDLTTKMSQDIEIGDVLIGDDGKKRIVEDLVTGQDEMYEIRQNNGMNYVVNSKHMLALKFTGKNSVSWIESINSWKICWFDRIQMNTKTKQFKISENLDKDSAKLEAHKYLENLNLESVILLTVDDYLKLDKWSKKNLLGFKSSKGIDYEKKEVDLDPYFLGLWLGDGTHTEPTIASNDSEIKDYIYNWCLHNDAELVQETKYKLRIRRKGYSFGKESINGEKYESVPDICDRTNPLTNLLKKYNLIGNKHIPKEYFMNSRDIRLKLLAGLIDTDGHVPKDQNGKRVVIIQCNETLSKQIINLAGSLGFVTNYRIRERKNVKIFDCEAKDYKNQYVINISGEKLEEIPTILPRKKCFGTLSNKDYLKTSIEVVPLGKGQYYGWSLSEKQNRRFLLPDFTVVKNCDQMWCTQCHTAFSWKTGAIQTNIHNPHYYEWQRKNGGAPRVAGDVECGQELNHTTFDNFRNAIVRGRHIKFIKNYNPNGYDWNMRHHSLNYNANRLSDIIRHTIHNERIELPQYRTDYLERNQELRVQYLCNEIDEDIFKILVQRNDKKHRKNNEICQVIQVLITAVTDIIFRIIDNLKKSASGEDKFDEIVCEFNGVREYCNEIFKDISFAYGCVQYGFDDHFVLRTIQKEKKAKKVKEGEV